MDRDFNSFADCEFSTYLRCDRTILRRRVAARRFGRPVL